MTTFLGVLFVILCVFLVLVVLIQKPKGGGLSGAFGGAGGSQQAVFGSRVGDVLTWTTVVIFTLMILLSITLVFKTRADAKGYDDPAAAQQEQIDGQTNSDGDGDPTPNDQKPPSTDDKTKTPEGDTSPATKPTDPPDSTPKSPDSNG